nr:unnamed protein product [Callosobruchus analis]
METKKVFNLKGTEFGICFSDKKDHATKKIEEDLILCKSECKLQYGSNFSLEARNTILRRFYKLDNNAKTCILFKSIDLRPVSRHRIRAAGKKQSLRQYSFKYSVTFQKEKVLVCKDAFCAVYQIGAKKIRNIQKQLTSGQTVPSPCKQGKHSNRPHKICVEVIDHINLSYRCIATFFKLNLTCRLGIQKVTPAVYAALEKTPLNIETI